MFGALKQMGRDFLPWLTATFVFVVVAAITIGKSATLNKAMIGVVVVVGIATWFFAKKQNQCSHKLFNASVFVGMAFSIALSIQTQMFSGFTAIKSTGNFIADKLLTNFLHLPWQSIIGDLFIYFILFFVFNFLFKQKLPA